MTRYDNSHNSKELDSTTVSGHAPLEDRGFYLLSTECKIVLKETNETYDYSSKVMNAKR